LPFPLAGETVDHAVSLRAVHEHAA
jgi:hypothetical protein